MFGNSSRVVARVGSVAIVVAFAFVCCALAAEGEAPTPTRHRMCGISFSVPSTWEASREARDGSCLIRLSPRNWAKTVERADVELFAGHVLEITVVPQALNATAIAEGMERHHDRWVDQPGTVDSQEVPLVRRNDLTLLTFQRRGGNRHYRDGHGNAGVVFHRIALVGTPIKTARIWETEPYFFPEAFQLIVESIAIDPPRRGRLP
jgi:hypothetical protein